MLVRFASAAGAAVGTIAGSNTKGALSPIEELMKFLGIEGEDEVTINVGFDKPKTETLQDKIMKHKKKKLMKN